MLTLQLRGGFNIKFEIGAGGCRLLHPAEESLRQDKSLDTSACPCHCSVAICGGTDLAECG
jgi:hypothetical protein